MRRTARSGSLQEARGVGHAEDLGEMQRRTGALQAAGHGEMILVAVEIGHEHHAGLVELGRRGEEVPRQRLGRLQDGAVAVEIIRRELSEGNGGGRRYGVESAQQSVRVAPIVSLDTGRRS